jgi:hypothetical protein
MAIIKPDRPAPVVYGYWIIHIFYSFLEFTFHALTVGSAIYNKFLRPGGWLFSKWISLVLSFLRWFRWLELILFRTSK